MVRQTRSSQRAPQASQSQPSRATQGSRARRTQVEEEPEEDHHPQDALDEGEGERSDGVSRPIFYVRTLPKRSHLFQEIDKKARDLVRLALFHEQRRLPLRRDEISKKGTFSILHTCGINLNVSFAVFGSGTRTFNAVLASANQILHKTFAMELVEMQAMPSDKDMSEKDADLLKNTGVKKKGEFFRCANPSSHGVLRDTR